MFAIVGTVPEESFPLSTGEVSLDKDKLCIQGRSVPVNRGTPALMAAAIKVCQIFNTEPPFGYLIGDIGLGFGSKKLYEYLIQNIPSQLKIITFHYLQPDVDWHNRILFALEECASRPILIADAGFMYMAKMSGEANAYDLFTPDVGELAFLADEKAPHPFYTRGFILQEENKVPDLITRAYFHQNAPRYLLVKGKTDYLASESGIIETVTKPATPALEAIGGTGDTLTGIASGLIASGLDIEKACIAAAKVNRLAGYYANPTPASQIIEIIQYIDKALKQVL
ncbi:MAG: NAD(P)H-hydrate dehydratase [Desulfonauticus sp.]|nr:NAD(P)H-hydrate dehydratase [Desulfonauticus sp.]